MLTKAILIVFSLFCYVHIQAQNQISEDPLEKGVGPTAFDPKLALNNQGQALIAWNTGGGVIGGSIQYAVYNQDSKAFGSAMVVPGLTISTERVAVTINNQGDAIVIWDTVTGNIQYSIYDKTTKTLGLAQTIEGAAPYSQDPSIVLNDEGDAIAAWYDAQMKVQYAIYHKIGKKFEMAKNLLDATTSVTPQIVMNNKGEAIVVWYDTVRESINYSLYDKIGKFRSVEKVLNTKNSLSPRIALNDEGDSILVWNTGAETTLSGDVQYSVYNKEARVFGPIKTLPSSNKGAIAQNGRPQISLNNRGEAILVGCRIAADGKDPIWYTIYNKSSKQFDLPKAVAEATIYSTAPEVTLNNKGEAMMAWFTTMNGTIEYAIYNQSLKAFKPTQKIINVGSNSEFPLIAFNNGGDGILVWGILGGIQYSIYDKNSKSFESARILSK